MVSNRIKSLLLLSIPIFVAHEIEEWVFEFWNMDNTTLAVAKYFDNIPQSVFIVWNFAFLLSLIFVALLVRGGKWTWFMLCIPGLIFIYELNHVIKAISVGGYYPGLYTSLIFPVIGFLYWKELFRSY